MSAKRLRTKGILVSLVSAGLLSPLAFAGTPMWTLTPTSPTTVAVPTNSKDMVSYTIQNQSSRAKTLVLLPTEGLTSSGACNLAPKGASGDSCKMTITIQGAQLPEDGVHGGPRVCQANGDGSANPNQCYQPSVVNLLHAVKLPTLVIGQAFQGGKVACLNGGLNNLIAATADVNQYLQWGGLGTAIGPGAQSDTDGRSNTAAIVASLGNNTSYAAKRCNDYEVDAQGNTPCLMGNTCYKDWFLPAGNNLTVSGQLNCLYTNKVLIGGFSDQGYWSSTEDSGSPTSQAGGQIFLNGTQLNGSKSIPIPVRCVRAFTP